MTKEELLKEHGKAVLYHLEHRNQPCAVCPQAAYPARLPCLGGGVGCEICHEFSGLDKFVQRCPCSSFATRAEAIKVAWLKLEELGILEEEEL